MTMGVPSHYRGKGEENITKRQGRFMPLPF
jgi:hypothetical protein